MTTKRQIAANKLNAQKSKGPRTRDGKQRVSWNATKHGLTSRDPLLPNENPDDFDSFRTDLLDDLAPQGGLQAALAEKMVADLWRLRRVAPSEAAIYRRGCQQLVVEQAEKAVRQYEEPIIFPLKEFTISDDLAHKDAQKRLEIERAKLDDLSLKVTRVLEMSSQSLSNLWRHESALSRSMWRTLHELQRLQAARAGEAVPAPAVVDVDLNLHESAPLDVEGTNETDRNQK